MVYFPPIVPIVCTLPVSFACRRHFFVFNVPVGHMKGGAEGSFYLCSFSDQNCLYDLYSSDFIAPKNPEPLIRLVKINFFLAKKVVLKHF